MYDKTLRILEYVSGNQENSTIQAISRQTGISKSTVHRIIKTLVDDQVVIPRPKSGYNLTPKLFAIGLNGLKQKNVMDLAVPILRNISQSTKETVSFYVLSGTERICVYHVEGEYPYSRTKIGDRGPLLKGSVGMVMAAFMDRTELSGIADLYMKEGTLTPEQIQSAMERLTLVKEQGYAVSMGARHPGTASLAVPIFDISGYVTAALSIATNIDRMTPEVIKYYSQILSDVAKQICM
ncbi:transcriptional regulator, IclR family [Sporobacter termitidis DSM 10068]|uniref:Transcriptional regulator, IclR family n=1 Tax=Sporobacter termitidis DSM 10068 TaxID=1123282 RepID=A0A1M5Z346_9FIRM|nr:IclR family transcriptional regulator [Sporobacter termitidis]SHI18687.1 transcriptional regulator, IclR family [Sporobacter termitidis DSM 10068]